MSHKKIYETIAEFGILTEGHRKNLESRGFTEHTIHENRFFSGGKHLLKAEEKLLADFKESELLESGVMMKPREHLALSNQLTDDRIIIPYLNEKNEITLLRPHKLGLKVGVQIYHEKNVSGDTLILTEGEFKAAAACQLGFPAIAVPGVGSFSGQHFPELAKFLDKYQVAKVIIVYDNEIKNDPRYDNYKQQPIDRWDTQYFAITMSKLLEKAGFQCLIATLPDQWREKGKIDIDGALAQGRTTEEFQAVINSAQTWKAYQRELCEEAQKVISRKLKKKYIKTHVKKEFGRYVASRWKGQEPYDEVISNFVIHIVATHDTSEGVVRKVKFVNEFKEESRIFSLDAANMGRADAFTTFCFNKGNFVWKGSTDDLKMIWETQFLEGETRMIVETDHVGYIPNEKMWLFSNVAFVDGQEIRPDSNGIFWMENKGVRPVSIQKVDSRGLPYLNFGEIDMREVRDKLGDCIGQNEANICIGWTTAVVFMEEVFKLFNCFPFLFLHGMRRHGKSTVAEWMMNCYGLINTGKQGEGTTPVALSRYLGYYSCLPVFLDESRNSRNVKDKDSLLRNVYNRQAAGKGVKAAGRVREEIVRGTMLITGEETPNDNALMTRCIPVLITESNRKVNQFNWFQQNRMKFSNHILQILQNFEEKKAIFIDKITGIKDDLVAMGLDDRMAINYAVMIAGYYVAFGEDAEFANFARWISKEVGLVKKEIDSESPMDVFLQDLEALQFKNDVVSKMVKIDGKNICIYFEGLYNVWEADYKMRKGELPFNKKAIKDYLVSHFSYLDRQSVRLDKVVKKCMRFNSDEAPEHMKGLVPEEEQDDRPKTPVEKEGI
jgi:DNA primase